jgi:hypothetical protein
MPASTLEDILNITKLFVIILLDSQPGSEPVAYQMSCPVPRPLMMMIMSMGHDVSELRPPTGLLFIPQVTDDHGQPWWNDINTGKLLIRPTGLSGKPTSRVI